MINKNESFLRFKLENKPRKLDIEDLNHLLNFPTSMSKLVYKEEDLHGFWYLLTRKEEYNSTKSLSLEVVAPT